MQDNFDLAARIDAEVHGAATDNGSNENVAKLAGKAFLHSAFQESLDGASQLVNHLAGQKVVGDPQIFKAPAPEPFGSKGWVAETAGSGLGVAVPFLVLEAVSKGGFSFAGKLAENTSIVRTLTMSADEATQAGAAARAVRFAAPAAKMAFDGASYGLLLTPSNEPNKSFWGQRGTAAITSALTFGTMGLTSRAIMVGAESKLGLALHDPAFKLSIDGIGFRVGANALGGAVGGSVSAESNSLMAGQGPSSKKQLEQSIASFLVTGASIDAAHAGAEFFHAADQEAHNRSLYAPPKLNALDKSLLESMQKIHFEYFRTQSDAATGLTKDRSTDTSPASIAAVGFSLTAHGVAADHGWLTRDEASDYTLKVLNTLWSSKQGPEATGTSGDHGFFYHFMDPKTGLRMGQNEVSTIDTALLMGGVLYAKNYFDGNGAKETQIRAVADKLYQRVDWNWALNEQGRLSMGWTPENGFIKSDWQAYNEAQILLLLAMGSPTHPLPATAWENYMSTAKASNQYGHTSLEFGPLFAHQYTQVWMDFRGKMDATNKKLGFDYFQNSRQAALAQHAYAVANPLKFRGYGDINWGLTASDGPGDATKEVDGQQRVFTGYNARGFPNAPDDGTIAPTAAASSLPFVPELAMPTIRNWMAPGSKILGSLGFQDAFNPTFDTSKTDGWVDPDTLGIDQGPILLMAENYRHNGVWQTMQNDANLQSALDKAGFSRRPVAASGVTWASHVIGKMKGLE